MNFWVRTALMILISTLPTTLAAASKSDASPKKKPVVKLIKKDLVTGKGDSAVTGKTVTVHYTGKLTDGTVFDSSVNRGQPFSFKLGAGQVIEGWEKGVEGMKVGGKRKLTIPSKMGYGEAGAPPVIPPNSPLEFEIELLGVN